MRSPPEALAMLAGLKGWPTPHPIQTAPAALRDLGTFSNALPMPIRTWFSCPEAGAPGPWVTSLDCPALSREPEPASACSEVGPWTPSPGSSMGRALAAVFGDRAALWVETGLRLVQHG
ncbi:MAG: hypothetical protein L6Q38_16335, partial [Nitrospira sp.]|nr:hypothetical protein [Nitrospira sp.]